MHKISVPVFATSVVQGHVASWWPNQAETQIRPARGFTHHHPWASLELMKWGIKKGTREPLETLVTLGHCKGRLGLEGASLLQDQKLATEWEGAVRTSKPSTLTPALPTAADRALSRACSRGPGDPRVLRGCRQLNKHNEALLSVKGWGRLPAPIGTGAFTVPGAAP